LQRKQRGLLAGSFGGRVKNDYKYGLLSVILMLLTACGEVKQVEETEPAYTYLALGDSYTIGEGVASDERYPEQLAAALNARGIAVQAPVIIAKTGWTTDELTAGINSRQLATTFDLVSLLIGVNNQYRGRDIENYRREFRRLLQEAVDFAAGRSDRVFVLSIPDWGVTPFAAGRDRQQIAREIDSFNAVKRAECVSRGVVFIDITPISRQAAENPALLAADGLHPSGEMYSAWVDAALGQVAALVAE
jgi:lysophospholipase L1-like esterase